MIMSYHFEMDAPMVAGTVDELVTYLRDIASDIEHGTRYAMIPGIGCQGAWWDVSSEEDE